jgi:hypothetical protein
VLKCRVTLSLIFMFIRDSRWHSHILMMAKIINNKNVAMQRGITLLLLLFIPLLLRTEHRASTVPRYPRLLFQFLASIRHLVGLLGGWISPAQGLYLHRTTQHRKTQTNIHSPTTIRTCDPNVRAAEDSTCLRPLGHWDRRGITLFPAKYAYTYYPEMFQITYILCEILIVCTVNVLEYIS